MHRILVINPGSTTTKFAVFHDDTCIYQANIDHSLEDLAVFAHVTDQYDYRKRVVLKALETEGIPFDFHAVIGRGGLTRPVPAGCFVVNERLLDDTRKAVYQHACNLGGFMALDLAQELPGCLALVADPGVVDEMNDEAHVSGFPELPRICIWHALNQRAIARRFAREQGSTYDALNLIICHAGGGISVAAHEKGRAVDANNALDGEGMFSPTRAGSLPAGDLVRLCFSGKYSESELVKRICATGGLTAHLGTNDLREVLARIEKGDTNAKRVLDAMLYHTAKQIAAEGAVLCGNVDAILLTGGMTYSTFFVEEITRRVGFLAPVYSYPGEGEMEALAENASAVLKGERKAQEWR